jgi:hypothetical protein
VTGGGEPPVEIERGADQREVREGLRKGAEMLPLRPQLLAVEPQGLAPFPPCDQASAPQQTGDYASAGRASLRHSGAVIALAISSQPQRAGFPLTHPVKSCACQTSWVKISQIRTLSVERLGRRMDVLNTDEVDHIIEGLVELVG